MRLFPDKVPEEVYDNLNAVVEQAFPSLHRYYELRRKTLDSKLRMYDRRARS
jgi:oligoendopeptidase F